MVSRDEYLKGMVLTSWSFRENDRMLWFYSQEKGKVLLFVKSGKKINSKLAPMISEPFALLNLKVVKGKAYFHLIGGEILEVFENIEKDYKRLLRLNETFEKITNILPRHEKNKKILSLIKSFLKAVDQKYDINLFNSFILKVLSFSGFMPQLNYCLVCNKNLEKGYFDIKKGGLVCKEHKSDKSFKISVKSLNLMKNLLLKDFQFLISKEFDKNASFRVSQIIERFYNWQI